mmetsp:Transcript_103228/g.301087  ORF Transcript_103228/g.301087 Transcript_103228/m.301087 type:complete len:97 (-) Transcript_103228:924-1214(-)
MCNCLCSGWSLSGNTLQCRHVCVEGRQETSDFLMARLELFIQSRQHTMVGFFAAVPPATEHRKQQIKKESLFGFAEDGMFGGDGKHLELVRLQVDL